MGQYYLVVNIDKKEYIKPRDFGDGAKLLEFGCSGDGTMLGLAILLSHGNGLGGGDLVSNNAVIGSWAGDRIVIAGDYADVGMFNDTYYRNLYSHAYDAYKNISNNVIQALIADDCLRDILKSRGVL